MNETQSHFEFDANDERREPQSVTCLGMNFASEEERRNYFTEELREKLKDPAFRQIEGFPIGEDEDILALSDPPYYTACPNPWIGDFIAEWETNKANNLARSLRDLERYSREPFAADVSEGKRDPIYNAHSYHTKVPYKAIVQYILHYTEPGDIVLDGFSGSGMVGIAAQICGAPPREFQMELEERWLSAGYHPPLWGLRQCILCDLSPAATFIAANYNLPFSTELFSASAQSLLKETEQEIGWMYETLHTDRRTKGHIEYTVWSEVFTCPECSSELVFLEEALDGETQRVKDRFHCSYCDAEISKRSLQKNYTAEFDDSIGKTRQIPKRIPALICYRVGQDKFEKKPEQVDLDVLQKIGQIALPSEIPSIELPYMHMTHERARMDRFGITHIHHFYLPRAAQALGALWKKAKLHPDARLRHMLMFWLDSNFVNLSVENRYRPEVSFPYNPLSGVYYVPSLVSEASPFTAYENKLKRMETAWQLDYQKTNATCISTNSATKMNTSSNSVDYIFTDPPFGENIYYADLNFKIESWYSVFSNATVEAIVDKAKKKGLIEYQDLIRRSFMEYYRILKPGRWITIVFHNSRNAVWNAIQEALQAAGFVVADVRTMDKQQGSYRQVTSMATKQDLVISAYKANGGLEERFKLTSGTEDGIWDFVRTHLGNLPVFVDTGGKSEVIAERKEYLLYDRMVAFHVQRGVRVPLSSAAFYAGLAQRFSERDGMYFLPNQAAIYDKKRLTVQGVEQLLLFVSDEASARQWLHEQLRQRPQTFQELHPQFIKEIGGWSKNETPLELSTILEQNFLRYDGIGPVPEKIHSYLSSNWKDMRNLTKDNSELIAKARDRWYVPDPSKAGDLEKLRERALLREFEGYLQAKKKLKVFRLEAVRAGFKKAWQERDYQTIVSVADKVPTNVLEEDPKLLMWYDQAMTRMEG